MAPLGSKLLRLGLDCGEGLPYYYYYYYYYDDSRLALSLHLPARTRTGQYSSLGLSLGFGAFWAFSNTSQLILLDHSQPSGPMHVDTW